MDASSVAVGASNGNGCSGGFPTGAGAFAAGIVDATEAILDATFESVETAFDPRFPTGFDPDDCQIKKPMPPHTRRTAMIQKIFFIKKE